MLLAVPARPAVIALSAFVTGVGIELFAVLGTEATLVGSAVFITLVTLPVFAVRDVRELRRT